jgi:ketol-acid reductoisomerase
MRYSVSDTAEWGDYISGPRVVNEETKKTMKKILSEIQDGSFAKDWIKENEDGRPRFNKFKKEGTDHQIETVGSELRKMMKWIDAK